MKLTTSRQGLTDITGWALTAVSQSMDVQRPHLSGIMLHAEGDMIRAAAYDYQIACRWAARAAVGEPGLALVPGRMLASVLGYLSAPEADLETQDGELVLRCGTARLTFPLLNADEYPYVPDTLPAAGVFGSAVLARALARTAVCADPGAEAPAKTVVRLEPSGATVTLTASDGQRLAIAPVPWEPAPDRAAVPASIRADLIRRWLSASRAVASGPVTMGLVTGETAGEEAAAVSFSAGERSMVFRCAVAPKMDWEAIAALKATACAEVEAAALAAVAKRLGTVLMEHQALWMTFSPGEIAFATRRVSGRAAGEDRLPVEYGGQPVTVGINHKFLETALDAVGGTVRIGIGPKSRLFFSRVPGSGGDTETPEDLQYQQMVMPMKDIPVS